MNISSPGQPRYDATAPGRRDAALHDPATNRRSRGSVDGSSADRQAANFDGRPSGRVRLPAENDPLSNSEYRQYLANSYQVRDPQLDDVLDASSGAPSRAGGGTTESNHGGVASTNSSSGSVFSQLDDLYAQMEAPGEKSMEQMQQLTMKMQRLQQLISMILEIKKIAHDMKMSAIRKMA